MKDLYVDPDKKESTVFSALAVSSLLWAFVFSNILIYFIIELNPGINLIYHRLYLLLFCFISFFLVFLIFNLLISFFCLITKLKVYQEYYFISYSFLIIMLNAGFLIIYRFYQPIITASEIMALWYILLIILSVFILSIIIIFFLLVLDKPIRTLSITFKGLLIIMIFFLGVYPIIKDGDFSAEKSLIIFPEPYDIVETETKVILIGMDGLYRDKIEELMDQDLLPNMKLLFQENNYFTLNNEGLDDLSIIWNSIYTSLKPEKHGIKNAYFTIMPLYEPISGKIEFPRASLIYYTSRMMKKAEIINTVPYNSSHRKARAIWDILSEKEKGSSLLGLKTAYPAYPIIGNMISDRMDSNTFDFFPNILEEQISDCIISLHDIDKELLGRYVEVSQLQGMDKNSIEYDKIQNIYQTISRDHTLLCFSEYLWEQEEEEFSFKSIYFHQIEKFNKGFRKYSLPDYFLDLDLKEIDLFGDIINKSYKTMDDYIGQILNDHMDENTFLILLSNNSDSPEDSMAVFHSPLLMENPIEKDIVSVYDIAPTVLYLLGFPYAEDFHGSILINDDIHGQLKKISTFGSKQ